MAPKNERSEPAQTNNKEVIEVLQEDADEIVISKRQKHWYDADSRFGWFQVLAAGITFFMLPGVTRSFSLLYEQLIERFQRSDSITAWVPSVHGTVKMCSSKLYFSNTYRLLHGLTCISLIFSPSTLHFPRPFGSREIQSLG